MMFLSRLLPRSVRSRKSADLIFRSVSQQSRHEDLFGEDRVPDTFEGRFEAVALHTALIMRRLRSVERDGGPVYETYCELLFSSFDHALRESAVGDLMVTKKIRKLGEALFGRVKTYDSAITSGESLKDALQRNLLASENDAFAFELVRYVCSADEVLAKQTDEAVLNGQISWPDPT